MTPSEAIALSRRIRRDATIRHACAIDPEGCTDYCDARAEAAAAKKGPRS